MICSERIVVSLKGVILAGGSGTRLSPITKIVNKHFLPVGKYPMIYWALLKLKEANVDNVLLIINQNDQLLYDKLIGDGRELGLKVTYKIQDEPLGIAHGVSLARSFVGDSKFIVLLGDNLFQDSLIKAVSDFNQDQKVAHVFLKKVTNPRAYGIAEIEWKTDKIKAIEEKPVNPKSDLCVTGIYLYDASVFRYIEQLVPSHRGELEITDLNNQLIKEGQLGYQMLNGWWIDAGTHESLYYANQLINGDRKESKHE